jgi:hypothetical protein
MSEITRVPLSEILGDGLTTKVEESWSKDVPSSYGANAPIEMTEINREKIMQEVAGKSARRFPRPRTVGDEVMERAQLKVITPAEHHFFVVKGKKLEYVGSLTITPEMKAIYQKDLSGRFFRQAIKAKFPGRKDYEEIISLEDTATVGDIAHLMRACE